MKKKILLSCLLTASMLAMTTTSAFATVAPPSGTVSWDGTGSGQTVITGTIKATQFVVTVPTTVAFTIDPSIDETIVAADQQAVAQIRQSVTDDVPDFKIINGSAVPIYAKVTDVAVSGASLVNAKTGLSANKTVMFGVKDTIPTDAFATAANYLTDATTSHYLVGTDGKVQTGQTVPLWIYGLTKTGWAVDDTFTVTPTITVSVTPF